MIIPWQGVQLSSLIEKLGPQAGAKFVAFETVVRPEEMPGQQRQILEWPYREGLRMDEARLASILDSPHVEALALTGPQGDIGLLELDFSQTSEPDLSYFGLAMHVTGQGVGTALMAQALTRARERGAHTLRVNTCSLDHPKALQFYVRNGFTPIRRAIEVFDDPRLDGTLPRSAAACLPVISGE